MRHNTAPLPDPSRILRVEDGQALVLNERTATITTAPAASESALPAPASVRIVSFGYGHDEQPAPEAHLTLDLRRHFRDPHISPQTRDLTARDALVRQAVMSTPGIRPLVLATVAAVEAYAAGPSATETTVAVGCAGGRHRAATVAMALAAILAGDTETAAELGLAAVAAHRPYDVELVHRDIDKPVLAR